MLLWNQSSIFGLDPTATNRRHGRGQRRGRHYHLRRYGAKYGYCLIRFLLILIPVAYYVQEMTVRLGAVTKRGHAEAIFDGANTRRWT